MTDVAQNKKLLRFGTDDPVCAHCRGATSAALARSSPMARSKFFAETVGGGENRSRPKRHVAKLIALPTLAIRCRHASSVQAFSTSTYLKTTTSQVLPIAGFVYHSVPTITRPNHTKRTSGQGCF